MGFPVYDFRKDIRNVLVTPEIRSRFLRMEVGQVNRGHSHDLGHEIFLILQGRAEFEIDGEKEVLEPGQMCIALVDQIHTVTNVGDEPVIMYLSVTPHILPTHTMWTDKGGKEPPHFNPSSAYDVPPDTTTPTETLADRHRQALEALSQTVEGAKAVVGQQTAAFKDAVSAGDRDAARRARDTMWSSLLGMYAEMYALAGLWNDLTARTAEETF